MKNTRNIMIDSVMRTPDSACGADPTSAPPFAMNGLRVCLRKEGGTFRTVRHAPAPGNEKKRPGRRTRPGLVGLCGGLRRHPVEVLQARQELDADARDVEPREDPAVDLGGGR